MRKILIIIPLVLMFSFSLNAFMAGNESCNAFPEGCDPGGRAKSGPTIGSLIIEGGHYFLKSGSDMLLFLSLFEISELSGPDYDAMQSAINSAIENMEKAKNAYYQLKNLAAITPYNQEVISRLIEFDYAKYQKENGLIPAIFEKVREYLIIGDVRGVYNEFYCNTGQILDVLYDLKKDVDANTLPNLSTLWRINQKFSEVKLFSQYIAEVFYSMR